MQKLPAHWCIAGVRHPSEILAKSFGGSMHGSIEEERFELLVSWIVDADAGVPLRFAAPFGRDWTSPVRNRIAFEFDRVSAAVADLLSLLVLEQVVSFGCQKQKPGLETDVLHVCQSASFTIGPLSFADGDVVFGNQLYIQGGRVFARFDATGNVEPVSVAEVRHSDLLDKSFWRCCYAAIRLALATANWFGADRDVVFRFR